MALHAGVGVFRRRLLDRQPSASLAVYAGNEVGS